MILSDEQIKADDWGTYNDFKQSHLEANAKLSKANERIRELEADLDRWFRDHRILNETFIKQCDRADRLAVIADTLAVELQYIAEAKLLELEAKLREIYGYLLQADKDGESNIPQELGNEIEELLR